MRFPQMQSRSMRTVPSLEMRRPQTQKFPPQTLHLGIGLSLSL